MTRRESREVAFSLLFEWSFKDEPIDEVLLLAKEARGLETDAFALDLVDKALKNREKIDLLIEQYSQGWKLSRISRTALAMLRISFCELTCFGNIPVGASINEAVELVKKFGSDEEASYINGILGSYERVRKGEKEAPPLPVHKEPEQPPQEAPKPQSEPEGPENPSSRDEDVELLTDIVVEVE